MLTLVLAFLAATTPLDGTYRATVDGNDYKVKVRRGEVKVSNAVTITAIRMGRSVERRRQMIAAVKLSTGCELTDPFWRDSVLVGALKCE